MLTSRIAKVFYLFIWAIFSSPLYAGNCDQLFGEWRGRVTQEHTFYKCEWDVDSIFVKQAGDIIRFQFKYFNPNHPHLCNSGYYEQMHGSCINGELWFGNMVYQGKIINNHIDLQGVVDRYRVTFDLTKSS